jgi:hypothetical protein
MVSVMGPGAAFVSLDQRSQRTPRRIATPEAYRQLATALGELPQDVK